VILQQHESSVSGRRRRRGRRNETTILMRKINRRAARRFRRAEKRRCEKSFAMVLGAPLCKQNPETDNVIIDAFNVRTLLSDDNHGLLHTLCDDVFYFGIDICCVSEVRWSGQGRCSSFSARPENPVPFIFLWSGEDAKSCVLAGSDFIRLSSEIQ
jgi:hypothetical protein